MTKQILLILIILISISCSRQENLKIINQKETKEYRISLYSIGTKINSKGKAQCSNYSETITGNDSYYSYGYNLLSMLVELNHTSKKYFDNLPTDTLRKLYLKVEIKNLTSNQLDYDSILQKFLLETFHLTIEKRKDTVVGFEFSILDENKLNNLISKDSLQPSTVTIHNDRIKTNGIQLYGFANNYDQHVKEYVTYSGQDTKLYSFDIPIFNDITKANEYLYKYGLILNKSQFIKTFYKIKNNANLVEPPVSN